MHLAIATLASVLALLMLLSRHFRELRLPLLVYQLSYITTTVVGASALLDDFGLAQFRILFPQYEPEKFPSVGSAVYWLLLLAPFLLVPAGAKLGSALGQTRLCVRCVDALPAEDKLIGVFYAVSGAVIVWAAYKLIQTDNYFPTALFDRSLSCDDRVIKRTQLFGELRYVYYAAAYAVAPMALLVAMYRWLKKPDIFRGLIFVSLLLIAFYLNLLIFMKANLVILVFTILLGLLVAGVGSLATYSTVFGAAALILLGMQAVLGCYQTAASISTPALTNVLVAAAHAGETQGAAAPSAAAAMNQQTPDRRLGSTRDAVERAAIAFVRLAVYRMASSFPYYVQVFSDPNERCGIESNRIPFLPKEKCFPPTKVSGQVFFQPAPAHLTAYAEIGPSYSLFVLVFSGVILGLAWRLSRQRSTPLFLASATATCVFAYYLTQVSLTGALTYAHGLLCYLFPVGAAIVAHALGNLILKRRQWVPDAARQSRTDE